MTTDKRRTSYLINRIRTPPVSYTEPFIFKKVILVPGPEPNQFILNPQHCHLLLCWNVVLPADRSILSILYAVPVPKSVILAIFGPDPAK